MNRALVASLMGVGVVGIIACAGGGGSGGASAGSYKGLGSIWTYGISGSNFTLDHDVNSDGTLDTAGADLTISGTSETYASTLFRKLTVSSATGANAPTIGTTAYSLEVPGFASFIQPIEANAKPIVALKSGTCPTGSRTLNWIIAKWDTSGPKGDDSSDGFGTAEMNASATGLTVNPYKFSDGSAMTTTGEMNIGSCNGSTYTFLDSSNTTVNMFATSAGGMLVNPGTGIIFASPQLSADPTLADLEGTYSGLIFNNNDGTQPARVTLNSTGDGTGVSINPETDADIGSSVTIDLTTVMTGFKGIVRGTINMGNGNFPLNCVFSLASGKKILACNGAENVATGAPAYYPAFFFLGSMR